MTNVDALFPPVSRGFYTFPNDQTTITFVIKTDGHVHEIPSLSQYAVLAIVANPGLL